MLQQLNNITENQNPILILFFVGPLLVNIRPATYPPLDNSSPHNAEQPSVSSPNRAKRGVAFPSDLWPQNSTIKISMSGMTPEQEQFTKNNINKWAPHVNLKFEFTNEANADVRIAGNNTAYAGSSKVGKNSKTPPTDAPSMSIGFANGLGEKTAGQVIHEFGHALGLKHEHQHPDRTLDFNKKTVYKHYESLGKPRSDGDSQMLNTFNPDKIYSSEYDQRSIMHYPFPGNFLNNNTPTPENNELSATDIQFISRMYPKY